MLEHFVDVCESNLIESGTYGSVYLSVHNGKECAVKKISLTKQFDSFLRESEMAIKTKHTKYSVPVYKCFAMNNAGYLVMENCKCDLFTLMRTECFFGERDAAKMFQKICLGVAELHSRNIAHLDLKLENILINQNDEVKLCDFGSAMSFEGREKRYYPTDKIGTPIYCAPEIIMKKPFLPVMADSWSLGVILHALVFQGFPVRSTKGPHDAYSNYTVDHVYQSPLSASCKSLLCRLLSLEPTSRLSVDEILQHPWINSSTTTENKRKFSSVRNILKKTSNLVL